VLPVGVALDDDVHALAAPEEDPGPQSPAHPDVERQLQHARAGGAGDARRVASVEPSSTTTIVALRDGLDQFLQDSGDRGRLVEGGAYHEQGLAHGLILVGSMRRTSPSATFRSPIRWERGYRTRTATGESRWMPLRRATATTGMFSSPAPCSPLKRFS
jgi:hypothetical protein